MHVRRRLVPLIAALAVTGGLAACGDDEDEPVAQQGVQEQADRTNGGAEVATAAALARAADKTAALGGVRMSLDQTMSFGGQGPIEATAQGVFDQKTGEGEMTLKMDLSSMPGVGALAGGAGELEQRIVFKDLVVYTNSPLFESFLPGGKKWMKVDLQKAGESMGIDFSALTQGASQDPTQTLKYLKGASGGVTKVGEEEVRGEPTTRYRATIDFEKVADSLPADQRKALGRTLEQITGSTGTSRIPVEVWIGADGVVRRMTQSFGSDVQGQSMQMKQTIELYDFGTDVDVDVPPADQVFDAAGALPKGLNLNPGG